MGFLTKMIGHRTNDISGKRRVPLGWANWLGTFVRLLRRAVSNPQFVVQRVNAQIQLRKSENVPWSARLRGKAIIEGSGSVHIGHHVLFLAHLTAIELHTREVGIIIVGDRTFINQGASISASESVRIGKDCHIGHYAFIYDSDIHGIMERHEAPPPAPINIGDRVWLGTRVTVLKGVTIGHDAVIGAGSVVTSDIPPRSLAVGLPARVIRTF